MWKTKFDTSYVGFMKDGAQWLVDNTNVKLVGELQVVSLVGLNHWPKMLSSKLVVALSSNPQSVETCIDNLFSGVDYLSVAAWDDLIPSHLVFLQSRVSEIIVTRLYRIARKQIDQLS